MKISTIKKVFSLLLAMVTCLSLLPMGTLAAEDAAVSLRERDLLLSSAEEGTPNEEEVPVVDVPLAGEEVITAEDTSAEELETEEKPTEQTAVWNAWINPVYADFITEEDLPRGGGISLDGAATSFSTAAAAGSYIRQQLIARAEEITFVFTGNLNDAIAVAMAHTGEPKEGDSLIYQIGGWSSRSYSDGTVMLWPVYYTTAEQEAALDETVVNIMESLDLPRASDYETVKAVHDYLCNTVTYGTTEDYTSWSAYGALVQKVCVCQGYALAVYRLLLACGIDCRIISGDGNGPHAWNIVKLGNCYYSLDATWDDQWFGVIYDYFLLGTTAFYQGHTPEAGGFEDYSRTSSFWDAYPMSLTDYDPSNPNGGVVEESGSGSGDDTEGIKISAAFPDEYFRAYVEDYVDLNGNGYLSQSEIESVISLDVSGLGILDMTGVGLFTELRELECYNNYLGELDVSNFLYLEYLDVSGNGLEILTLGEQNSLYALYCENNSLEELDITGCPELWFLWCHNNTLEELDITGCPSLVDLSCYDNYIEELDVSTCPVLASLVESVEPTYYYDYGIVDYYAYLEEENLHLDLAVDIGVTIRFRAFRGDVNLDGDINAADAALVMRHAVGMGTLTGEAVAQADLNLDGSIDARDAAQILRYENGLSSLLE